MFDVTDEQIEALRRESQDHAMKDLCKRALAGDVYARSTCAHIITHEFAVWRANNPTLPSARRTIRRRY